MAFMYLKLHENSTEKQKRSWKSGIRALGVAESFQKNDSHSIVVGVVMRGDLRVDGFGICRPTVGGTDATKALIGLFQNINRDDIRVWLLGGAVISWFNVIDIHQLAENTGVPVVCVSYEPSEGLTKYLQEYFPDDWQKRDEIVKRNGERKHVVLNTGHKVFVNTARISHVDALTLLNRFTLDGKVPEPIRLARIIASSLRRDAVMFQI